MGRQDKKCRSAFPKIDERTLEFEGGSGREGRALRVLEAGKAERPLVTTTGGHGGREALHQLRTERKGNCNPHQAPLPKKKNNLITHSISINSSDRDHKSVSRPKKARAGAVRGERGARRHVLDGGRGCAGPEGALRQRPRGHNHVGGRHPHPRLLLRRSAPPEPGVRLLSPTPVEPPGVLPCPRRRLRFHRPARHPRAHRAQRLRRGGLRRTSGRELGLFCPVETDPRETERERRTAGACRAERRHARRPFRDELHDRWGPLSVGPAHRVPRDIVPLHIHQHPRRGLQGTANPLTARHHHPLPSCCTTR